MLMPSRRNRRSGKISPMVMEWGLMELPGATNGTEAGTGGGVDAAVVVAEDEEVSRAVDGVGSGMAPKASGRNGRLESIDTRLSNKGRCSCSVS